MKKSIITLKDVAQKSGFSISTVSKVINNEKYVSETTKKKINATLNKLNYHPEWSARSLRLRKTNIIGIIIPMITDYFFSSIVLGAEDYFRIKQKDIILFNTSNNENIEEKAIKLAISKRVEGVILATIYKKNKIIKSIIENYEIPFVIVDNKINVNDVDFVSSDDLNGSNKLVSHLIKAHGYKRIACISGPINESSGFEKLEGYKKAFIENGLLINNNYIKIANWNQKEAYIATKELMNLKDKPRAIYCANAKMLLGCMKYLNEHNVKIPQEVALVTFDDYDFVSAMNPPITTLKRVDLDIGKKAAELLLNRINGKMEKYQEIRIDSDLVVRKSCGC